MTTFYYGDKWKARLRNMGIHDVPHDGSTPIPQFLEEEVKSARKTSDRFTAPGLDVWESLFLPLLEDWACTIFTNNNLSDENSRLQFFSSMLKKYHLKFNENCKKIEYKLKKSLRQISDMMKEQDEKLQFDAILRGSSSDGTKIGPSDEYDYKAKLHVDPSDPVLMKFYPTMWEVLTVYKQEQDPADDLKMLGHCLHSARLLAIVFRWKNDLLVKVDLTPTVAGGKWQGRRKADPLGDKIKIHHYFILPGSDKQPPIECQPTLKPDTSYAEQNTLDNMPPLLKDAITLLKILINPCFTPDICPNSPKGTKPTSYNLKDGCYWALFMNGEDAYDIDDYNIKHIMTAAVDILSNIMKNEYFEIEKKEVKCHKAIRNIYKTLLLGRPTTDSPHFLSLLPKSREKVPVSRDVKTADPEDRKHNHEPNTETSKPIPDLSLPEYKPVGVYRINELKFLGEGSFGKVFEAIHSTNYIKVAAKEISLKFKEEHKNERLKKEAQILSQISSHLNIVKYIDHFETDNRIWIFTELCDQNLNEFCKKNKTPMEKKLDMMKQMARAIHHLHTCKPRVAHRDVKPSNILVIIGEECCVKVTDFGMSKHADSNMSSMNTYAGTVAYMAPEVHREQSHDVKVDVFSLALVFEDFIIASLRYLKPLQEDGKPLGTWMIDIKNKTGDFPLVPISFNVTLNSGMKVLRGLISAMLSGEAADRPSMEVVLKELDLVDHLLNEPVNTSDNSAEEVSTHLERSDRENCQEQLPSDAISTPEQLSGASCTDEQCSDAGTTEEQTPGKTEEQAGINVNYTCNRAQFADLSNPVLVESRLRYLDLEISSCVKGQTFGDVSANDIDEPQNHSKWLKEIQTEGSREWKRRMALDSSKGHQRAVLLFMAVHPEITGKNVCDGCYTPVTNQYRCLQCTNVDLCARCYAAGVLRGGHKEQHQMIHLGLQCAGCHGYIVGSRIHCDQCGVDLCVDCQQSGGYCSHLEPNSTQRMKPRKWPFTMRRIVQYLDLAITAPPSSVSVNQEHDAAADVNQEHKLDSDLVTQQLVSACVSNDLGFVVQWLADHHGQTVDVHWRQLVTLALDIGVHDIVDCLLQSDRVAQPGDGTTRPGNHHQITMEPSKAALQVAMETPSSGSGAEALVLVGGQPDTGKISLGCYIRAGLGWQRLTTTPERQWGATVCGVGTNSFVIVGGHDGYSNRHGHCNQYSVATGEWARRADMPTPRAVAGCVSDGCKVWCMGGNASESKNYVVPIDACEVLDLCTGVWERLPRMLQAMYRPIVCLLNRTILVLMNDTKNNAATMRRGVRTLQALPCDGGEWSHRCPLPDSVGRTYGASAAACGGSMYVVGGSGRLCEKYDPMTDAWTHLSPPPRRHHYGAVAAMAGGRLVLAGGDETTGGEVTGGDAVDEYDVHTDTWVTAPYRLPIKVLSHGLVVCRV